MLQSRRLTVIKTRKASSRHQQDFSFFHRRWKISTTERIEVGFAYDKNSRTSGIGNGMERPLVSII